MRLLMSNFFPALAFTFMKNAPLVGMSAMLLALLNLEILSVFVILCKLKNLFLFGGSVKMTDLIPFSLRISDTARRKLKVIAGYEDISINTVIIDAIEEKIADWEKTHGVIAIPSEK